MMARVAASANVRRVLLVAALVATAMVLGAQMSQAQTTQSCTNQLSNLNVCAPFVVPGASASPNSACCGALQAVEHGCLCSTLAIISRLPSMCNVPPLTCAGN